MPAPSLPTPMATEGALGYLPLPSFSPGVPLLLPPYAPNVVSVSPAPGEEVRLDAALTWTFNRPMDRQSFADAFRLTPSALGSLVWQSDLQVSFVPDRLSPATRYVADLAPADQRAPADRQVDAPDQSGVALSTDGLPLSSATRQVHGATVAFSTLSPLRVIEVSPAGGARDVRTDAPVLLTFNRPVVPEACSGADAGAVGCPELPLLVSPAGAGRGTWLHPSLYRYEVLNGFVAGQRYTVSLVPNPAGNGAPSPVSFADVEGATLEAPPAWTFDTALPQVVAIWPPEAAQRVALDSPIQVHFATPMDRVMSAAAFSLSTEAGASVAGSIQWSDGGAMLTFTPVEPLALDTIYVARIGERARATSSTPLAEARTWWFRTVPAPRLVGVSTLEGVELPAGAPRTAGAPQTAGSPPLWLQFAGLFDAEILEDAVRISPEPTDGEVHALYDRETGRMSVAWRHLPGTEYCVTLAPNVVDVYGNTPASFETTCLVTEDLAPSLDLVVPISGGLPPRHRWRPAWGLPDAIVLDAGRPRELVFAATNVPSAQFTLEQIGISDMLRSQVESRSPLRVWTQAFDPEPNQAAAITVTLQGLPPLSLSTPEPARPGLYHLIWRIPGVDTEGEVRLAVVDRSLTLKLSETEALVWVTDLTSGVPISRTAVKLLDRDGLLLAGGSTDGDGVARLPLIPAAGVGGAEVLAAGEPVAAMVGEPGAEGFGFVVSGWSAQAPPWAFGIDVANREAPPARVTFFATDRRIYSRADLVSYAGFVRDRVSPTPAREAATGYGYAPPGTDVDVVLGGGLTLVLRDAGDRVVLTETPAEAGDGLFSGSLRLPEDISPGQYSLDVSGAEPGSASAVTITVVTPEPMSLVQVHPEVEAVTLGETARFLVEVRSLSPAGGAYASPGTTGLPQGELWVDWEVVAAPVSFPLGVGPSLGSDEPTIAWRWGGAAPSDGPRVVARGAGVTDAAGRLSIEVEAPADLRAPADQRAQVEAWTLRAVVAERGRQSDAPPAAGTGRLLVYPADRVIGMRPNAWIFRPRQRVTLDLLLVDRDVFDAGRDRRGGSVGAMGVGDVELSVELVQRGWTVSEEGAARSYSDTLVAEQVASTDIAGLTRVAFALPHPGAYLVRARTTDEAGRSVLAEIPLWVGDGALTRDAYPADAVGLQLVLDADTYRVGDVARLLVLSDAAGAGNLAGGPAHLLLTVEREGVLLVQRYAFDAANPIVEIPVLREYLPNVVISCVLVGPATALSAGWVSVGFVRLDVDVSEALLTVDIRPERADYQPGDRADFTLQVTSHVTSPVEAQVLLALREVTSVVQESLPHLSDGPGLRDLFFGDRALGVVTATGLRTRADGSPAALGVFDMGSGLGVAPAEPVSLSLLGELGAGLANAADLDREASLFRRDWLKTDANGRLHFTVDLPERVATWMVKAWAVTGETQVGEGSAAVTTTKPLFIQPITPAFVVAGDRVELAAWVHNLTDEDLVVAAWLEEAAGIHLLSPSHVELIVPARGVARTSWACRITDATDRGSEEALVWPVFGARSGDLVDIRQPAWGPNGEAGVPVYRYRQRDVTGVAGVLEEGGERAEAFAPLPIGARLSLRADPSLSSVIVGTEDDGSPQPPGAGTLTTERWVSTLLQAVTAYRARQAVGLERATYSDRISDVLDRLYVRQNADGGWGWHAGTSSLVGASADRWALSSVQDTTYVLYGFWTAEEAGFTVSRTSTDAALTYVHATIGEGIAAGERAVPYALGLRLLAATGRAWPEGAGAALYGARERLGVVGRGHLALAFAAVDGADTRVATLLGELRAAAIPTAAGLYWEDLDRGAGVTSVQATAVALETLIRLAPEDALVLRVVRWLLLSRAPGGWATPYESAWALSALSHLEPNDGAVVPPETGRQAGFDWQVAVNDAWVMGGGAEEGMGQSFTSGANRAGLGVRPAGRDVVQFVRGDGPGDLYYAMQIDYAASAETLSEGERRGIAVERRFCRMEEVSPSPSAPQEVGVRSNGRYAQATWDACEPVTGVKVGDLVEVRLLLIVPETRHFLRLDAPYPAGFIPLHGNHEIEIGAAVFYVHDLPAGAHHFSYLLQAVVPGRYQALPAVVEETYFPEIWGRSALHVLEVWPAAE